jgi:hypothetical protein
MFWVLKFIVQEQTNENIFNFIHHVYLYFANHFCYDDCETKLKKKKRDAKIIYDHYLLKFIEV